MNKVQSKHYSLLFQEDADLNEDILSIHNENISDEDDDDDGFKSMIGEDEDPEIDIEDDDDDIQEGDCSDEEIFSSNQHRSLANDGLRPGSQLNYGRKNDYHLLKNNEIDKKPISLSFEAPIGEVWTPTPMSPVRRAFFLASIMFGVLVVAMFLWALPCDVQPCDSELKLGPQQWFSEIDNIGVNYTKLLENINGDLSLFVSFYSVEKFQGIQNIRNISEENFETKVDLFPKGCGLLRLAENTGKESWKIGLDECPQHINCDLMDATGDGLLDCLILGHSSMAMMFEPIYGNIFWHVHVHGKDNDTLQPSMHHFELPIMLQDLDDDGFKELLFPVNGLTSIDVEKDRKSLLVLVSGRTGAVIGKPFNILSCNKILQIFREDVSIGYSCLMENRSELVGKIPFTNLLNEIGHNFEHDKFHNESFNFKNNKAVPETNEAVCQMKYINKGKCPYCKTRIQLGLSSDNPLHKDFEYSTVVSWKILSFANVCKGALLKLWKWDVSSLQEAFMENAPTKSSEQTTKKVFKEEMDFNFENFDEPQVDETYKNLFSDQIPDEVYKDGSFNNEYDTKRPFLDKSRREAEQTYDYVTQIRQREKPFRPDVLKSKRFYEHPTILQHNNQPVVNGNISTTKNKNTSSSPSYRTKGSFPFLADIVNREQTLPPSTILPPEGYRLQKLEEVLVLVLFNGTDWLSRDLGSMVVYQLCQKGCIPSHNSQKDTVQIDINDLRNPRWNIYVSSSTFSSYRKDASNATATWSLESYVRKLITDVENKRDIL